jgi:RHS repeat-associated protein
MYWTKDNRMQSYNNLQASFKNAVTRGVSDIKYFLVNDRLGSGTVVTNQNGGTEQVLCAHTFGDDLLDLNNGYETPYQVFGYEIDAESGLMCSEQRYYGGHRGHPFFYSTDPLWFEYPDIQSYHFCHNDPINRTDPTGEGDPLTVMKVRRMKKWNTFGMVRNGGTTPHQGIDYHALIGTSIYAIKDGKVVAVSRGKDYGLGLTLEFTDDNGETRWAYYGHLSEISVGNLNYKEDDLNIGTYNMLKTPIDVKEGDELGKTGDSGNAKGMRKEDQHLHFENRDKGTRLGAGLKDRKDPNNIVDTKFKDDPNNSGKVIQVKQPKYPDK